MTGAELRAIRRHGKVLGMVDTLSALADACGVSPDADGVARAWKRGEVLSLTNDHPQ